MKFLKVKLSLILILFYLSYLTDNVIGQENSFEVFLTSEENSSLSINGEANFTNASSLYSILLRSDKLRCGLHFSGLKKNLGAGTYTIQAKDSPGLGAVCLQPDIENPEKMLSESGKVIVKNIARGKVEGSFEIHFRGGISEKEFKLSGTFLATEL